MSSNEQSRPYWVEPENLSTVAQSFSEYSSSDGTFWKACRSAQSCMTEKFSIAGLEHIPREINKPIILLKNHPHHFDFAYLADVFQLRPDVRVLAKRSQILERLPPAHFIFIDKQQEVDIQGLRGMIQHLRNGGSMLATPWGMFDHMAGVLTEEEIIQNALNYAKRQPKGIILPTEIHVEFPSSGVFPLKKAHVSIQEPIESDDNEKIEDAVLGLYRTFIQGGYKKI